MKRGYLDCGHAETSASLTPSNSAPRTMKPPSKSISKRPRFDNRSFCTPKVPDDTPATFTKNGPVSVWPSSAQRKFENLGMHTPTLDVPVPEKRPNNSSNLEPMSSNHLSSEAIQLQEDDEGFILFSQNDYVRGSQAFGTPEPIPEAQISDDTHGATTTFLGFQSQPSILQQGGLHLSQLTQAGTQLSSQPTICSIVDIEPRLLNSSHNTSVAVENDMDSIFQQDAASQPFSTCISDNQLSQHPPPMCTSENHAVTPELGCALALSKVKNDEPASQGPKVPSIPKMFNIFMPKHAQRYLLIIRHGESEYNRAMSEGKDFRDPMIFDPHLTRRGIEQARALRSRLQQQLALHGEPLWVVSPLRRAIQTFLEACPLLHPGPTSTSPSSASSSSVAPPSSGTPPTPGMNVEVLPTISEFVASVGDVGTPASVLASEFPKLAPQLAKVPEHWWFQPPEKINSAVLKQFEAREPKEHQVKRVSELARWLSSRQERFIIMIGHSSFWHEFRGKTEKRMDNGEMRSMHW